MKKTFIILLTALLNVILLTGCSSKRSSYTYSVNDYEHPSELYISQATYYDDKVEFVFKGEGNPELDGFSLSFGNENEMFNDVNFAAKNNKLTVYFDDPEQITAVSMTNYSCDYYFRYLDSGNCVCIWRYWAEDLGWVNFEGDTDRYYTEAEKAEQKRKQEEAAERARLAKEEDDRLFEIFKGKWTCKTREYFEIFERDSNHYFIHYYPDRDEYEEWPVTLSKTEYFDNLYEMSYEEQGWGINIWYSVELSEDQTSFIYNDKVFYHAEDCID